MPHQRGQAACVQSQALEQAAGQGLDAVIGAAGIMQHVPGVCQVLSATAGRAQNNVSCCWYPNCR